jgi:predicted double-glycine peptidase
MRLLMQLLIPIVALLVAFVIGADDALGVNGNGQSREVKSLLEMRHDRTIVQEWDLSCGAAALATLLTYQHGDPVSEREIAAQLIRREEYIANPELVRVRQGFSLLDLKRYVNSRGYRGVGYGRLSMDDLIARAPIIVAVDFLGYNHFVIFRGVQGDRVLLSDPAWGNRTMRRQRFEDSWIEFPEIGKTGFVIQRQDGVTPPNRLDPRPSDFVMLR